LDPATSLSEGTLLLTCNPDRASELVEKLRRNRIGAYVIGRVGAGEGVWLESSSKRLTRANPARDMYWRAYRRGLKSGLR
jgi:hydrogenase maturation factor